jgi:hypothetical protein
MAHTNHTPSHGSDMKAAFIGLIGGAIALGALMYAVVVWTNSRYASHAPEPSAVESPR